MTDTKNGVTFEDVEKVASRMLAQGIKPSVRDVRKLTGGRNETVAEYLNNFNAKRDLDVSKLADEIGSSAIGKLIASEVQSIVERRTSSLSEIQVRQKDQIEELIDLLKENERECSDSVALAVAQRATAINEANSKIEKHIDKANNADQDNSLAQELLLQIKIDTDTTIASVELKTQAQIKASETQAQSLVAAANKQTDKAESETVSLREQVKLLSIDQARHELEKEQLAQAQRKLDDLLTELAEIKTSNVRFESQTASLEKDALRLNNDLIEFKEQATQLPKAQAQLVETQKQISVLQQELSQSERERESLSRALAVSENK